MQKIVRLLVYVTAFGLAFDASVLVLGLWAHLAHAELPDPEKAQVRALYDVADNLHWAQFDTTLAAKGTTTANQSSIADAFYAEQQAQIAVDQAMGLLLGFPSEDDAACVPRAQMLRDAWGRLDRALAEFGYVTTALQAAQAATVDTGHQNELYRGWSIFIAAARVEVAVFDRTLPYANPRPPAYPGISGGRGIYDEAGAAAILSLGFFSQIWDSALPLYTSAPLWTGTPGTFDWIYRLAVRMKVVQPAVRAAMLSWARIPIDAADVAAGPQATIDFRILPLLKDTSESGGGMNGRAPFSGAGYQLDNFGFDVRPTLLQMVIARPSVAPLVAAFEERTEAGWRYYDGAGAYDLEDTPAGAPICP